MKKKIINHILKNVVFMSQYVQVLLPNGKQEVMVVTQEEKKVMISQQMQK